MVCLTLSLLLKLQCVQNATARLLAQQPKHCHITPLLTELHWLSVTQRIEFKVILMVFKALNDMAQECISELITRKPNSFRSLRFNQQNLPIVPRFCSVTFGDRSFRIADTVLLYGAIYPPK